MVAYGLYDGCVGVVYAAVVKHFQVYLCGALRGVAHALADGFYGYAHGVCDACP